MTPQQRFEAAACKSDLGVFIRQAWPMMEPGLDLKWNWHLDIIVDRLMRATAGEFDRLVINVPPGTGKSWIVGVFWPAWEWITDPTLQYLTISFSDINTKRDNKRCRDLVKSDWYTSLFPHVKVRRGEDMKTIFYLESGGVRVASSIRGSITGQHPDRIIVDDPLKPQEIHSETRAKIDECIEFYSGTLSTRTSRQPIIATVMQRLHEDDPSGYLLSKAKQGGRPVEHVCLPMRYDPSFEHTMEEDPRTEAGELLWPEFKSEDEVSFLEAELGPYSASGQLGQNPKPPDHGFFQYSMFRFIDESEVPMGQLLKCRGWDTADPFSGTRDRTAGVKLGIDVGDPRHIRKDNLALQTLDIYILHVVSDKSEEVGPLIDRWANLDGRETLVREEREGGSAGKAVTRARSRGLLGFDYEEETVHKRDKIVRAGPFRSHCVMGRVFIVNGEWNAEYLKVMTGFPTASRDDEVDGTSCAYNGLVKYIDRLKSGQYGTFGRRKKWERR